MPPAAKPTHTCPLFDPPAAPPPPVSHNTAGQQIIAIGQTKVFIDGQLAIVAQDTCVCLGTPNQVSSGSSKVFFQNKPAARQGDPTAHGGSITQGSTKVFIN